MSFIINIASIGLYDHDIFTRDLPENGYNLKMPSTKIITLSFTDFVTLSPEIGK